jgi:sodium/proline symporter
VNIPLAILFLAVYIIIVVVIGLVQSRKESEDGFMIADKQVHGPQLIATLSAGFFDGATLGIYIAYVFQYGLSAIWFFVGTILGFILLLKYSYKIKTKADSVGAYSMSEYFYKIFDKKNGLLFSIFLLIEYFGLLIVNLIIAGKIFSTIFPVSYSIGVIVGGLIILTYLLLAGFKAVIKTDFFQLIIMFLMTFTVGGVLFEKASITVADLNVFNIESGDAVAFLIIGSLLIFADPAVWQRIFASRDVKTLRSSLGWASVVLFVLALVVSIVGLATKRIYPDILPEDALVVGFTHLLPSIIKELGLVLLYAVSLSSSDTVTFVISSIFTRDLKNYTKRFSEESMKKLSRIFMVLSVFAVVLTALIYKDIIAIGFSISGVVIALVPIIFGSLYWKLNNKAVFYSLLLGLLTIIVLFITNNVTPQNIILSFPVTLVSFLLLQLFYWLKTRKDGLVQNNL